MENGEGLMEGETAIMEGLQSVKLMPWIQGIFRVSIR
jgi:hypothetical protein